jgi:hypothetical protein
MRAFEFRIGAHILIGEIRKTADWHRSAALSMSSIIFLLRSCNFPPSTTGVLGDRPIAFMARASSSKISCVRRWILNGVKFRAGRSALWTEVADSELTSRLVARAPPAARPTLRRREASFSFDHLIAPPSSESGTLTPRTWRVPLTAELCSTAILVPRSASGPHSGPSRGDLCRRASRPIATSIVPICYVRFTSIPAVGKRK